MCDYCDQLLVPTFNCYTEDKYDNHSISVSRHINSMKISLKGLCRTCESKLYYILCRRVHTFHNTSIYPRVCKSCRCIEPPNNIFDVCYNCGVARYARAIKNNLLVHKKIVLNNNYTRYI